MPLKPLLAGLDVYGFLGAEGFISLRSSIPSARRGGPCKRIKIRRGLYKEPLFCCRKFSLKQAWLNPRQQKRLRFSSKPLRIFIRLWELRDSKVERQLELARIPFGAGRKPSNKLGFILATP